MALELTFLVLAGCSLNYRRASVNTRTPRAVLQPLWQKPLVEHGLLYFRPQEFAVPAFDRRGTIFVGSSAGTFYAFSPGGRVRWKLPIGGGISSNPLFFDDLSMVFFGTGDGHLYGVHAYSGKVAWKFPLKGTVVNRPEYHAGLLLFTSNENRVYAVDAQSGKWRWQYDREFPEGFTVQGHAGVCARNGFVYTGFADGILVALKVSTGEVIWSRSLRGENKEFRDADVTPVFANGSLIAGGYGTGVFSLNPDTGSVLWHYPLEGVTSVAENQGVLLVNAGRTGIVALTSQGEELWRQAPLAGLFSHPVSFGDYVLLSRTEGGLIVASRRTGELLQSFLPGLGITARPAVGAGMVAVLGNSGKLYVFGLVAASDAWATDAIASTPVTTAIH